jgi:adenine-specific DNA-methyltransferase
LISFWYKIWFKSLSLAGGYLQISPETISKIPIPQIEFNDQKPFITLADQILSAKKQNPEADTSHLEREIDRLVYRLYNLTEVEIEIMQRS